MYMPFGLLLIFCFKFYGAYCEHGAEQFNKMSFRCVLLSFSLNQYYTWIYQINKTIHSVNTNSVYYTENLYWVEKQLSE